MKDNRTMQPIWPEIFQTGKIKDDYMDAAICAIGLQGWALCMSGNKPPYLFGKVMAAIGTRLNCPPTLKGLEEKARKEGWL